MPAPTKEIVTRGGHKVVIKEFLSGRERRAINAVVFGSLKITVEGKSANVGEVPGSVATGIEDETIRQMVVSVDGVTENVLELCLDLPEADFDDVTKAIETLVVDLQKKTA